MQELNPHILKRFRIVKYAVLITTLDPILDLIHLSTGINIIAPTTQPETGWIRVLLVLGGGLVCISMSKGFESGSHARKALMFTGFGAFALTVVKINPFIGNMLPLRLLGDVTAVILFAIAFFEACQVRKAN